MAENSSWVMAPGSDLRPKTLVVVLIGLLLVGCVIGLGSTVLFEKFDPKWGTYTCFGALVIGLILAVGNLRHSLLFIAAFTLPLNIEVRIFTRDSAGSKGIFLTAPDMCVLVLIALLLLGMLANKREQIRWCPRTTMPWLLLLIGVNLSLPFSFEKTQTVYYGVVLIQHILLYFVFANLLRTEADVSRALKFLVLGLTLGSALYLLSCFTGKDFNVVTGEAKSLEGMEEYGGVVRPSGTFGHPIQAGQYFNAAVWIPLALLSTTRHGLTRVLLYAIFAVGCICTVYTLSRSAYIGFIGGLLCYLICGVRVGLVRPGTGVKIAVIILLLLMVVGGLAWDRLTLDDGGSGEVRKPLNQQAIYIALKHPLVGVGAGAYKSAMWGNQPPGVTIPWQNYVHNEYLLWWAECGTIGLLALLLFLFSAARTGFRTLKNRSLTHKAAGFALVCMLAALVPNIWFDAGVVAATTACARLMAVVLGINAAAIAIAQERQGVEAKLASGARCVAPSG
ncbi:MAG: O-antigen ligase family protein [Candidatus Hydrogenedentes bacterium]|nr:O-antigen ligase family protein [Candidatus Hydrogenedentota bacterium]